jgi:bifunctional non-homologous end joining protein LigD
MGLEGIVCKQIDAPYHAGRRRDWLKLKCAGREEFVVLGWTAPQGSRSGIGSLHLGFFDADGRLHYVGGVGTGFSDTELKAIRAQLDGLAEKTSPPGLLYAGDPPPRDIRWVRPALVVEVQFLGWSGAGKLRHAVYLGMREDKSAGEVVREIPDPEAARQTLAKPAAGARIVRGTAPAKRHTPAPARPKSAGARTVVAKPPERTADAIEGVRLSHPDRELWPSITKRDLAAYWVSIAEHALPELARRPLALVRCPEGVEGEHFFQKHAKPGMPPALRGGEADGAPYLAFDDLPGLIAAVQISTIELHAWGATEADALHPDRLVFDLDPGEGITTADLAAAARNIRARLAKLNLESFCRTSGGKGLHVVVPLQPEADWKTARAFCRAFAETMEQEEPTKFVASVPKARRHGRILVDWLRNGLGSTAVGSFCPRARPGAHVATPLFWQEVTPKLDLAAFDLKTVPERLRRQKTDPWAGIFELKQRLPPFATKPRLKSGRS